MIQDITRPDVNGVPAKMQSVEAKAQSVLSAPYLVIRCDDNIMSNVTVWGALDTKEEWANGIFHNGKHFIASFVPAKGARYYTPGGDVTVAVNTKHYKLGTFRKYTGPVDKAVAKLQAWIEAERLMDISMTVI